MTRSAYAPVIDEQTRTRHDHQAARQRRHALRRAQQLCEDLTELLGRLGARQSPSVAADLRATARTTARDLYRLVAGPQSPPTLRQRRQELTTAVLDDLVEQLDVALSDVRAGFRASQRALDLAAVVAAGVEAFTSAGG
jgi:hypothetical protein